MVLTNSGLAQNCTSKSKLKPSWPLSPVTAGNLHSSHEMYGFDQIISAQARTFGRCQSGDNERSAYSEL